MTNKNISFNLAFSFIIFLRRENGVAEKYYGYDIIYEYKIIPRLYQSFNNSVR